MGDTTLEVLIPKDTEIDFAYLLTSGDGLDPVDTASLHDQRSLLYFDESLPVYVALRTPYKDEAHLKSHIARLAITLEVFAYGFQVRPSGGQDESKENSPSRIQDVLWTGNIESLVEPMIIVQEKNGLEMGRHVLAIWRKKIPLCRPRIRLQSPMVVFKTFATLGPRREQHDNSFIDAILPSRIPAPINVLQALKDDPALQGVVPKLPASRLSSVRRKSYGENICEDTLMIHAQKECRALPAISSRVRYSRSNGHNGKPSTIACLDIETAPFSTETIRITDIGMQLSDGLAEKVENKNAPTLPLTCRAKDNPVFLFCLSPNEAFQGSSSSSSTRNVLITVHASVLVSETCRPRIEMRWKTGVDFSTALNPTFGAPRQSMQRMRRPNSLSRNSTVANSVNAPVSHEADLSAKASLSQSRERAASVSDFGVSITFAAPKKVQVGRPFSWDILILNRSNKPRQLVITVIPKRRKAFTGAHLSKMSTSLAEARRDGDIAAAVTDEDVLYAMQRDGRHEPTEVISLSTDVKVGLLAPDSCFSAKLILLSLAQGYSQVEAIRVSDVVTNEFTDIRDLPDIVAVG